MSTFFLTCLLITTFCYGKAAREYSPSSYELQLEITELKHQIHTLKVDMQLMEEKVDTQKNPELLVDYKALQSRIQRQENTIDHLSSGIKNIKRSIQQLLDHQNKTEIQLNAHENRLQNVSELKNTLATLLKKMHSSATKKQSYRVKSGDSLEKIAKLHHISVETIKTNNKLTSDTIFIGQELQISHDTK